MSHCVETIASLVSERNRKRKFRLFLDTLSPRKEEAVLDVGVNDEEYSKSDNYLEKHFPFPERITAVSKDGLDHFKKRYPHIHVVRADGQELPFQENEFSISYSNAVIEHVGGYDDQLRFLKELVRVGQRGFLTTPNRYFPIEIHTRVPFLHILLPKNFFDAFLRKIGKGWATGNYMNLLSLGELRSLLNEARVPNYHIFKNRILGYTATFTVVWDKKIPHRTQTL